MPDLTQIGMTYWAWFIAATVLAIAEILAPGIFMIWLALAAAATGVLTLLFGLAWELQLASFAVFAVAAVVIGRNYLRRHPVVSQDSGLNRRGDRLVGQQVRVIDAITDGKGRVAVGDSAWSATGPDTPAGALVRVSGVDGATLTVEPLS
jgi:membrane protein implicated in regulation of membrane protease activity